MKTFLSFLLFFVIHSTLNAQNDKVKYITLKEYYSLTDKHLTKEDSLNLTVKNNDSVLKISKNELKLIKRNYRKLKRKNIGTRYYISLKQYHDNYSKPLTKKDSLSFKIREHDTLVLIEDNTKKKYSRGVTYTYKDSTFLDLYKKVAFKHKNDSVSEKSTLKYWKNDIKIYFGNNVSEEVKNSFMKFAKKISRNIDSLNISRVNKIEKSNFIIYYFDDYNYESRLLNTKSSDYYMFWNNQNEINKCAIKINNIKLFNDKLRLIKLKELFFKTLGHFKTSNELICESYFSNCYSEDKKIQSIDWELLKYHYDYGIGKGISLGIFNKIHKESKEKLRKGHSVRIRHREKK